MSECEPEKYLKEALVEATRRRGYCAPNPAVGAIVVKDGVIVGRGTHWACGRPHAEVGALEAAGEAACGATIYITLEPCCHQGRTPPCTALILEKGIKTVYYGHRDPNPRVAGKGEAQLKAAGIACTCLELPEIKQFYSSYQHWTEYRLPKVTVKLAVSQDRKIAGADGEPAALTGEGCRQATHQGRERADAILTTIDTVINDDPQLNVRLNDTVVAKSVYVLDSECRLPLMARLFETAQKITLFHRSDADFLRLESLRQQGVTCIAVQHENNYLNLRAVLAYIGEDGVHDLWVEAGGRCVSSFLRSDLVDRFLLYCSDKVINEGVDAFPEGFYGLPSLKLIQGSACGQDVILEFSR